MSDRREERLRELRLRRALGELDPWAEPPLPGPGEVPDEYELAAAALYLAFEGGRTPLPARLRREVEARALDHLVSPPE